MDFVITLGKCSNFFLTMLGDFCSYHGMEAKIQRDYKKESIGNAFAKYNLDDGKSNISELKMKFRKEAFYDYKGYSKFSFLMLHFPSFLEESIKYYDPRINVYFNEQQVIFFLVTQYAAFYYANSSVKEKEYFKAFLYFHTTKTYNDFLKDSNVNIKELSENCNWSSLEEILKSANSDEVYNNENELAYDCMILVQHYLFLGFMKALKEVFLFSEDSIKTLKYNLEEKIDYIAKRQLANIVYIYTIKKPVGLNYEDIDTPQKMIFSLLNIDIPALREMFYTEEEWNQKTFQYIMKHKVETFYPYLKVDASVFFINSYTRIAKAESDKWIEMLKSLNEEFYDKAIIPWYKARTAIFSLTFTDKEKDKELKEEACTLFRETFNNYKYLIGNNLQEFLSDAIACDVYCNPKKDILGNSQDNTDESSIKLSGKAYWEFGYALNIFDADSKKTYLLTFNAAQNFWTNFSPAKFEHQEEAMKIFFMETKNSEFELPALLKGFNNPEKIDNLTSMKRKDLRQPLGNRYYSNLSIRCLKANGSKINPNEPSDFIYINKYINRNKDNKDILFINDENGANALIRSLERYKMLSYGFTDENLIERANILNDSWSKENHGYFQNGNDQDEYLDKCLSDCIYKISSFYNNISNIAKGTIEDREKLKSEIKKNIILPLVENAGDHIFDEAIVLDCKKCVTALQIAIDCFDYEIVKAIVENLPESADLSKMLISSEYVTPLQYAVRKYDYLMQFSEMIYSKNHKIDLLVKRNIHSKKLIDKGILNCDKEFYSSNDMIFHITNTIPQEECGLLLTGFRDESNKNICSVQQKNLIEIIKLLAEKTNPISVDTFYYLADQIDPKDGHVFKDVFDITKLLIERGHADLCGTDFEWNRGPFEPSQTLLAYCINYRNKRGDSKQKNYDMLDFLLSNYPEKFKPSINRLIRCFDNEGNERCDTDLHFFITNQIESIKVWNDPSLVDDEQMHAENFHKEYGKIIASRMNHFLTLFLKAGAKFDIPDHNNKTVLDYLREWKDKMPEDCIPNEIMKMM